VRLAPGSDAGVTTRMMPRRSRRWQSDAAYSLHIHQGRLAQLVRSS
jgi:hypothetical protein